MLSLRRLVSLPPVKVLVPVSVVCSAIYLYIRHTRRYQASISRVFSWTPETLRSRICEASVYAESRNTLASIETTSQIVTDNNINFLVRTAKALRQKAAASNDKAKKKNPFLPPFEDGQLIAELSLSHSLVFNKFNLVKHHVLVITKEFQSQLELLTQADIEATWLTMKALNGLAFFNCGPNSGASQPHKHIQIVPLPLAAGVDSVPIQAAVQAAPKTTGGLFTIPQFDFEHICLLHQGVDSILSAYHRVLNHLDLMAPIHPKRNYNLLLSQEWLLVVPRRCAKVDSIDINALAFAGTLFVRSESDLNQVKSRGPLNILADACYPTVVSTV